MRHSNLSLGIILLAFSACVDEKTIGEGTDQSGEASVGGAHAAAGGEAAVGGANAAAGGEAAVGGANAAAGGEAAVGGASPATGGSTGDPGIACIATIAEAQAIWTARCPDTYAAAQAWADACSDSIRNRSSGLCNGVPTVTVSWGTHFKSCYYDPSALTLVGVIAKDDQKSFCGFRFYEMVAGRFPEGNDDSMGDPWARHCHFPTGRVSCTDPLGQGTAGSGSL